MWLVDVETTYSVTPLGCSVAVVEPGNAPSYQWAIDEAAGVRVGHVKIEARTLFDPLQTADEFTGSLFAAPGAMGKPVKRLFESAGAASVTRAAMTAAGTRANRYMRTSPSDGETQP